jgi:phage baseplate assembly protein gpV
MWYGVPEYGDSFKFKWYGATTEVASITGTGLFTTVSTNITSTTASTSNTTGALKVAGGIGVKGNVSANGIIFDDGTRQTTAASGDATLGDVLALSIALG